MEAYAAVVSLMNTLDNVHSHSHFSTSFDNNQIESLGHSLDIFLEFVESGKSYGDMNKREVENLKSQIASTAHAAEDLIESHIVDQLRAEYSVLRYVYKPIFSCCLPLIYMAFKVREMFHLDTVKLQLQKILDEMDPIKKQVREGSRTVESPHLDSTIAESSSSTSPTTRNTSMVGFDNYLYQLLGRLTGQQSDRHIIPITGMGGIGKTFLARNAYENLLTVQYFDVRAWVTISQEYNVSRIFVEILSCLGVSFGGNEHQLGEKLHKTLAGRRYLIILDDVWSVDVWDKVKLYLPDYGNRSRIVVTSRISSVANYFGSLSLALDLLDGDESWNLFCECVFGKEICPPELEEMGKNIAEKCSGLPLSIVVIGGLLRKSPRSHEYWKYVARDLSSILLYSTEESECFKVLSFSYNHLPVCVRPCFLYLGVFPEDYKIPVPRLIRLWVSEGFLKPNKVQSLEQVAEGYMKELVDRNLVVLVRDFEGTSESCMIHDLVRDYCIKLAQREKIFHVLQEYDPFPTEERRVVIPHSVWKIYKPPLTRSIILSKYGSYSRLYCSVRLLRVLEELDFYVDILYQQFNLRSISSYPFGLSQQFSLISLFWNLQTLYVRTFPVEVPSEIWEMRQLRHIECHEIRIPSPRRSGSVLANLHTLKRTYALSFGEKVCKAMPNIKDLYISHVASRFYCRQYYFVRLTKLESLCLSDYVVEREQLAQNLSFPLSLRSLTLSGCRIQCEDLTMIGSLPHLEVLSLLEDGVVGPEWNPVEGEFLRLKLLKINMCRDLIRWSADSSHFPVLEKLVLEDSKLNEIPQDIGQIPTLEHVRVINSSCSLAVSAARLLVERESLGDDGLQVQVKFSSGYMHYEFEKTVEPEVLTSLNFKLVY